MLYQNTRAAKLIKGFKTIFGLRSRAHRESGRGDAPLHKSTFLDLPYFDPVKLFFFFINSM